MATPKPETIRIAGLDTRLVNAVQPHRTPVLLLHGSSPGVTPFCSGMHIWDTVLPALATERGVLALDLPGAGGTALPPGTAATMDGWGAHVLATLEGAGVRRCHVVGHDEGGLLALWLALNAPQHVASVGVVASRTAAPAGDGLPTLALSDPILPLFGATSQAWAFEQISYVYAHVTATFLEACVAAARGPAHRGVVEAMEANPALRSAFAQTVGKTKSGLFRVYRETGVPMPVQLVWGSDDPLTGVDRGFGLFELIARKQPITRFDVINRTGNLPFREEPQAFLDTVNAFHEAVEAS